MFQILYPLLKHALGPSADEFTDGAQMYTWIKTYYDKYITKEDYESLLLPTEGSCAFGYAFIAWVVDSLDDETGPSNKGTFWSKIRAEEGALNVERAHVLQEIARLSKIRAEEGALNVERAHVLQEIARFASASVSSSSPPAYFTVTITGPFVNERLPPRWRSATIEIESCPRWQPQECTMLVLYLRLAHQMIFSVPMAEESAASELREDLKIDVGSASDMSCDFVIKSPVFSGSLISWRMGGEEGEHRHTLATMQELLVAVNVKCEQYFRSVISPLLRALSVS